MYKSIFITVLIFIGGLALIGIEGSDGETDVQNYLPDNPYSVYVYSNANKQQFVVIQNDSISDGCVNQYTINLSEEYPPTFILSKDSMEDFLQNTDSDKFYKSNTFTCFKDHKIYTKTVKSFNKTETYHQLYGEEEWEYSFRKDYKYKCKSNVEKSVDLFQKKRDVIHTICIDEKHNSILQSWFAEGIGQYQSEGNAGKTTLKSIHVLKK
ncbi:hypothetical protein [Sulfurovum sp.]|uniref:hypothetical protein n=1 Tax=Sulfurovum sp. TaxID=1969726 RepID=UPI00356851C6